MAHAKGTYLGGVRSLADLRDRSHIDPDSGCWCWRQYTTKHGHAYLRLILGGVAVKSMGRRAALLLSGKSPDAGQVAYAVATCFDESCVNPKHARWGTTSDRMRQAAARGAFSAPERRANLMAANKLRMKLSDVQRLEVALSTGPRADIAGRLGISPDRVSQLRRGTKAAVAISVFDWRP